LIFHPDLVQGTPLGQTLNKYSFFSYGTTEALHLSEKERNLVLNCFDKLEHEIQQPVDKHSKTLLSNHIELMLNYCLRFYDRQFITRRDVNKDILAKFEQVLDGYFQSELVRTAGLPTVKYCADQLHLSVNYFGDLIKKETGRSAQENIHLKVMTLARERMHDHRKTISEIAYEMGFKYPQHFSRMFKNETGFTPTEFRSVN
ncbi:MAG: helix-turn-helix transcriptional regulator, partial [Bacteroidetes bacterium]|nr:helix-turn-helix transcriptional regulator [Bacteroidota bacterium]